MAMLTDDPDCDSEILWISHRILQRTNFKNSFPESCSSQLTSFPSQHTQRPQKSLVLAKIHRILF